MARPGFIVSPEEEERKRQELAAAIDRTDEFGGAVYGNSRGAAVYDEQRYRYLAGRQPDAIQLNTSQQDETRGLQADAGRLQVDASHGNSRDTAYLRDAAMGGPSEAQRYGVNMRERAVNAQTSAAGSVRGTAGQRAAAYRAATQNAATMRADINQGLEAERAGETARAREGYARAAGTARYAGFGNARDMYSQDVGVAATNADLALQNTEARRQNERFYEGLGANVHNIDARSKARSQGAKTTSSLDNARMQHDEDISSAAKFKDVVGAGVGAVRGAAKMGADPGDDDITSDERAKEAADGDYGENADESSLDDRYAQQANPPAPWLDEYIVDSKAQEEASKGVAGAPKGYAKSRMGKPGSMFGYNPDVDASVPGVTGRDHQRAPGTDDWRRYGLGGKFEGNPDWSRGGTTKPAPPNPVSSKSSKKPGPTGFMGFLAKLKTLSDDKTKLAAAWDEGHAAARADVEKLSKMDPKKLGELAKTNKLAASVKETRRAAWNDGSIATRSSAAAEEKPDPKLREAQMAVVRRQFKTPDFSGADTMPTLPPPEPPTPPTYEAPMEKGGEPYAWYSDKRSKRPDSNKPSDEAMADAARSMQSSAYTYKPGFAESQGQDQGEVNIGPMANNMARDPVASTAIDKDPKTGLLMIDKDKGMKVVMGSLASLQHQVDALKGKRKAA